MDMNSTMDNSKDMMDTPEMRARIEQLAKDNNMSFEDAKKYYMDQQSQMGQS